jgi:hypothetical protein
MPQRARGDVALLSVCSRIHYEASLLPFTLNPIRCTSLQTLAQLPSLLTVEQRSTYKVLHLVTVVGQRRKLNRILDTHDPWNTTLRELLPGVQEIVVELGEYPGEWEFKDDIEEYMEDLGEWLKSGDGGDDKVKVTWEEFWHHCIAAAPDY